MTPREIDGRRYWTPRILTANTVLSGGAIVLWFFVSSWVLDIKTTLSKNDDAIQNITSLMSDRHTAGAIWKAETTDRINYIDGRLAKVEAKVFREQ